MRSDAKSSHLALEFMRFDLAFRSFDLIELRTAEVSDASLRIYGVAKILSRDPATGDLGGHAAILKKNLGRKGGRKKKPPQEETPEPAAS
jgi:hypothetical protein